VSFHIDASAWCINVLEPGEGELKALQSCHEFIASRNLNAGSVVMVRNPGTDFSGLCTQEPELTKQVVHVTNTVNCGSISSG
jgi:hypothetical protein